MLESSPRAVGIKYTLSELYVKYYIQYLYSGMIVLSVASVEACRFSPAEDDEVRGDHVERQSRLERRADVFLTRIARLEDDVRHQVLILTLVSQYQYHARCPANKARCCIKPTN